MVSIKEIAKKIVSCLVISAITVWAVYFLILGVSKIIGLF